MQHSIAQSIVLISPINLKEKFNLKIIWIFGGLLILILLIFSIFQVNQMTRENFLVKSYKNRIGQLSENSELLKIDWAKSNSLVNIEQYLQTQNFKKVGQVRYIRILESSVVKSK